jgi:gamma-glutamylcyclotransferase (GGCT)/AIG2-like uncharacterized protein YtfP
LAECKDTAELVFFYGTLLPPFVPEAMRDVVGHLRFCGEGSVPGVLYDLGEYPGAVFDATEDKRVFGAVFQLPEEPQVLEVLDRYEGYESSSDASSLFVRKLVHVDLTTAGAVKCWAYEYNGNPREAPMIASGRYQSPG